MDFCTVFGIMFYRKFKGDTLMKTRKKNEGEASITLRMAFPLALAVLLLASGIPKANAELITIGIQAKVDGVIDDGPGAGYLEGKIDVNDIITGYYTYESTTLDSNPSSQVGDYWHYNSTAGIFLTVGGFEFQTDPANVDFLVEIVNDNVWTETDAYSLRSYKNLPISNGALVDYIFWELQDSTMMAISDDALPILPPDLSDWSSNLLHIDGVTRTFEIWGHVTTVEIVPEPATILLLGLGSLLLRKRR